MSTCNRIDKAVLHEELSDTFEELCERRSTVDLLLRISIVHSSKRSRVNALRTCLSYSSELFAKLGETGFPRRSHKASIFTDYLEAFGETALILVCPS